MQKLVILILSLVLAIFGMTILISILIIHTHHVRKVFVGSVGVLSAMLMYSSPLVAVVSTISYGSSRNMEYMYKQLGIMTKACTWI